MIDITICSGKNCPVREKCYRYTAPPNEYWQSFFIEPPIKIEDGKMICDHYWGEGNPFIALNNIKNEQR
jgi:hypothetical protein